MKTITGTCAVLLTLVISADGQATAQRADLKYNIRPDQVAPYKVKITADTPTAMETMEGVVVYEGKKSTDNALVVEYRGGLRKVVKTKGNSGFGPRGRFGPSRIGPPAFPRSPFDRMSFRGLTTATNTLTLTPYGEISNMRGDSQLPYLLGNLSLMAFEPLPQDGAAEWKEGSGVTITTSSSRSRFGPRFGPFADNEESQKGGGELAEYRIQKDAGNLVTVSKTYSLNSPAATDEETAFDMKGTGTWVFNRELGMLESIDMKLDLVRDTNNTRVTIPITIAWSRMSEDEYAAHQKKVAEERAALEERMAKQRAEKEAAGPQPISEFRRKTILRQLNNDHWVAVWGQLESLNRIGPTPAVPEDMDIVMQVGILRGHSHEKVRTSAETLWAKWKETFEKLASDEQKAAVAASVAPDVADAASPEKMDDADNPFQDVDEDDGRGLRVWTDKSGRFKIEGRFVKLDGTMVELKRDTGKLVRIPKSRLSKKDQELVDRLTAKE